MSFSCPKPGGVELCLKGEGSLEWIIKWDACTWSPLEAGSVVFQTSSIQDHTFVESPGADELEGSSALCAKRPHHNLGLFLLPLFPGAVPVPPRPTPRPRLQGPGQGRIAPSPPTGAGAADSVAERSHRRDPPIVTRAPLT